jgi:hypothetical protein
LPSGVFHAGVTWQVERDLAVLLEGLTREDFGEEICGVSLEPVTIRNFLQELSE